MHHTTIAILAGGRSRRMGRDKAGIVVGGEGLLARTARLAQAVCPDVLVVGRPAPPDWAASGVTFRPDADGGGQGPLGGLATALDAAPGRTVLLVACDLPGLTADALAWLLERGREMAAGGDGLVTVNGGQREPLFALYAPACLGLVRRQLDAGRRSLQALIDAGAFAFADAPPAVGAALQDIDTPEQWAALAPR